MVFGKKYDTAHLSGEDKTWVENIRSMGGWANALKAAVEENRGGRVEYLLGYHKISREDRTALVEAAIKAKASQPLAVLLAKRGFDFSDSSQGDREYTHKFFKQVLQTRDIESWKLLVQYNDQASGSGIAKEKPVMMAAKAGWRAAVGHRLDRADSKDSAAFGLALEAMSTREPDDLAFVLSWTAKFHNHGPALNEALMAVAEKGSLQKAALLLEKGADPNAEAGLPMYNALAFGHKAVFELLVEKGGDLKTYGRDIVTRLRQQNPGSPLLDMATTRVEEAISRYERDAIESRGQQRYHLVAADSFSETLHLPEGRRLTTIFNFSMRQQTVIAETPAAEGYPSSVGVAVRDFDDIKDPAVIEEAAAQLVKLGGTVPDTPARVLPKVSGLSRPAGR